MDLWADDFELPPAHAPRRRDPRKVVLAALVAAIVLVGVITVLVRDDDRPEHVAAAEDDPVVPSPTVDEVSTTTAEPTTTSTTSESDPTTTVAGIPINPEGDHVIRGRAVDADGQPIEGLYVYPAGMGYPWGKTDVDGRYAAPCIIGSVLLSGAPINVMTHDDAGLVTAVQSLDRSADQNFVPTLAQLPDGSPTSEACGAPGPEVVTVMQRGGILGGALSDDDPALMDGVSEPDQYVLVFVELSPYAEVGPHRLCLPFCNDLSAVAFKPDRPGPEETIPAGMRYQIVGIPPGDVRVAVRDPDAPDGYEIRTVHIEAGAFTELDLESAP